MSKNHVVHAISNALHDVQVLTIEQLSERYDIEVDSDGSVWDNLEGRYFESLQEWAEYIDSFSDDDIGACKKMNNKHRYDDND